jgi:hypothetical protein
VIIRSEGALRDASAFGEGNSSYGEANRLALCKLDPLPSREQAAEDAQRAVLETEIARVEREQLAVLADIRDLTDRLLHRDV